VITETAQPDLAALAWKLLIDEEHPIPAFLAVEMLRDAGLEREAAFKRLCEEAAEWVGCKWENREVAVEPLPFMNWRTNGRYSAHAIRMLWDGEVAGALDKISFITRTSDHYIGVFAIHFDRAVAVLRAVQKLE
jgi:hypothetical protein